MNPLTTNVTCWKQTDCQVPLYQGVGEMVDVVDDGSLRFGSVLVEIKKDSGSEVLVPDSLVKIGMGVLKVDEM